MPIPPADLIERGLYHPEGWLSEEPDRWRWYTGKRGTKQALHRLRLCGFAIHRNLDGTYWFLKSAEFGKGEVVGIPAKFRKYRTQASAERAIAPGDEMYYIALLSDGDDDGKTLGYIVCDPDAWTDEDEEQLGRSMRRKVRLVPMGKVYVKEQLINA